VTPSHVVLLNESGVPCDTERLGSLLSYLLDALRLSRDCELGVTLVDEQRMSTLHVEWMGEPGPTDVLSFPIDEVRSAPMGEDAQSGVLGDIVLCPSFAVAQAEAAGRTLDEELQFLVTHGMLHLIGYDHATQQDYETMFALQDTLLDDWRRS
jgi:probable rRNA maturation factor